MKFILTLLLLVVSFLHVVAQSADAISYQAVVRDATGHLLANKSIGIQIQLLQGSNTGTVVYRESHTTTTNTNGLLSLSIGNGTVTQGDYQAIDWSLKPYFVQIDLDLEGGTNYTTYSTTELASVPYAIHAQTAKQLADPIQADQGLEIVDNTVKLSDGDNINDIKIWDGATWVNKSISVTTQSVGYNQPFSIRDPYLGLNYQIALEGVFPSRNGDYPFIGEILLFAGNFDIRGFTFCNGQILAISQYTALFSLVGTTYGGNGQTTFAVPDLRGRSPIHFGQGNGLSNINLGQVGGSETATLYLGNLPAHHHPATVIFGAP